jgi:hypothetical protein
MKAVVHAAAAAAALFSQAAMASCYVVYAPNKEIVYRAPVPPVDMSRQIHETLPLIAPGASMVFSPDHFGCELTINKLPLVATSTRGPGMRPARADRG